LSFQGENCIVKIMTINNAFMQENSLPLCVFNLYSALKKKMKIYNRNVSQVPCWESDIKRKTILAYS